MLSSIGSEPKSRNPARLEEAVINIQHGDLALREEFILANKPFILKRVAEFKKQGGQDESSDEFSIALIAFNEAINTFNIIKGKSFLGYAQMVINNRLVDHARKTQRDKNVVSLEGYSKSQPEEAPLEIATEEPGFARLEVREEITALVKDLRKFQISLQDLVRLSPKQAPTRQRLIGIARLVHNDPRLLQSLKSTGRLPIKHLQEVLPASRGSLEQNRKYIIALVLIMDSELDTIKEYVKAWERRDHLES